MTISGRYYSDGESLLIVTKTERYYSDDVVDESTLYAGSVMR